MLVNNSGSGAITKISKYGSMAAKVITILLGVVFAILILVEYSSYLDVESTVNADYEKKVEMGEMQTFEDSDIYNDPRMVKAEESLGVLLYNVFYASFIFIGVGLFLSLVFGLYFLVVNFKRNYKILISFIILGLVALIASSQTTGLTKNMGAFYDEEKIDLDWLFIGEIGMYSAFIFIVLAAIGSLAGFVVRLVK